MLLATVDSIRQWRLAPKGSAMWLKAREGRITASRMADVMAFNLPTAAQAKEAGFKLVTDAVTAGMKGKEGAPRINYRLEKIAERITGRAEEHYVSREMDEGTEKEPYARAAYEAAEGVDVDQVGFIVHPEMNFYGASPDGLVSADGGLEIKAPKVTTHITYLQNGIIPPDYEWQMLANMDCNERSWWEFLSYCPEMPTGSRTFLKRLERDDKRIAIMRDYVRRFEEEMNAVLDSLGWAGPVEMYDAPQQEDYGELGITDADINDWYAQHMPQ